MDNPLASRRGAPLQVPASAIRDLVHHPGAGCIPRRGHAFFQKRTVLSIQAPNLFRTALGICAVLEIGRFAL
jgi:hypothetical protein